MHNGLRPRFRTFQEWLSTVREGNVIGSRRRKNLLDPCASPLLSVPTSTWRQFGQVPNRLACSIPRPTSNPSRYSTPYSTVEDILVCGYFKAQLFQRHQDYIVVFCARYVMVVIVKKHTIIWRRYHIGISLADCNNIIIVLW